MIASTPATALRLGSAIVVACALSSAPAAQSRNQLPLQFTAQGQNLNQDIGFPQQAPIEITITRWSTAGERERLLTVVREDGTKGLLEMMPNVPRVGAIRVPGNLNYEFHFAMRSDTPEGGQEITLITDRPVGFAEAVDKPRTLEYRFLVIQLSLNPIGQGQGRLSVATRVSWDRFSKDLQLETWENLYITLRDVKRAGTR
jgi:hypothetical protein